MKKEPVKNIVVTATWDKDSYNRRDAAWASILNVTGQVDFGVRLWRISQGMEFKPNRPVTEREEKLLIDTLMLDALEGNNEVHVTVDYSDTKSPPETATLRSEKRRLQHRRLGVMRSPAPPKAPKKSIFLIRLCKVLLGKIRDIIQQAKEAD